MNRLPRLILILAAVAGLSACGITAPSRAPGYAELDLPRAGLKRDTSISIGPRVLGFAARHANEGPETQAMLEALDGIRVRVYRVDENAKLAWLYEQVTRNAQRLREADWEPIMRVVEDDSVAHVLVLPEGEGLLGLAIISVDQEELVFINVMGRLDPEAIEALASTATLASQPDATAGSTGTD